MQAKLELYRIFKKVADCSSISEAAKEMYISQSAVSQSIKALEDALGVKLFSRSKRGVCLTKDGSAIYEYVSAGLGMIESGEARLGESKKLTRGELVIGASNTITENYLLPFLREYHRLYPGVNVKILNGTSKKVMDYLSASLVDIAFATTNEKPADFESFLCFHTHTAFVAAPDYPLDFDKVYTLSDVATMPLILLEKEAGSRRFLEDCFLKEGLRLEPEIELASYELLISLAGIGLGVAAITEELSKADIDGGRVRKLSVDAQLPQRAVSMLMPKSTNPSMAARKFMELVQN